jgi:tRNA(fMet)-specific endonuclease VapC
VKYLLDTNVCVDYLNGRFPSVIARLQEARPDEVCTSSIVAAELRYGAEKSSHRRQNHARLDELLGEIAVVDFDVEAAATYGRLRATLERDGTVIGPNDMLIGAHALALRVVLVTDNTREFSRVRGIRLQNWRE